MSVMLSTEDGWIVSHLHYLNKIYKSVKDIDTFCSLEFNDIFFEINSQFLRDNQVAKLEQGILKEEGRKSRKRKKSDKLSQEHLEQINYVKEAFLRIQSCAAATKLFESSNNYDNNKGARSAADNFYSECSQHKLGNFCGSNKVHTPIITEAGNEKYVFPERCSFYCYDVREIGQKLDHKQFNFILLDPPWWNKFIRRKKERFVESSYKMMYNNDFAKIPLQNLLTTDGIVAVWCTNAPSHLDSIMNEMFPTWGVVYIARWYWVKVTQSGNTVCDFNTTAGKQPYESLIFGRKSIDNDTIIPDKKLLISVPSGVHSHKPPIAGTAAFSYIHSHEYFLHGFEIFLKLSDKSYMLEEVIRIFTYTDVSELVKPYIPENPKCLEIFARYLLPDWTSWGLEVLKFQHLSLYRTVQHDQSSEKSRNDNQL